MEVGQKWFHYNLFRFTTVINTICNESTMCMWMLQEYRVCWSFLSLQKTLCSWWTRGEIVEIYVNESWLQPAKAWLVGTAFLTHRLLSKSPFIIHKNSPFRFVYFDFAHYWFFWAIETIFNSAGIREYNVTKLKRCLKHDPCNSEQGDLYDMPENLLNINDSYTICASRVGKSLTSFFSL